MRPGARRSPTACRCTRRAPTSCPTTARAAARSTPTARSSGAFRGFGVPQAAIAQETLFDDLADRLGIDRLEFRLQQRAARRRHDRDRPGARRRASASSPASRRCEPHWAARAGRCGGVQRGSAAASGAASASPACGTAAATPRCPTRRPSASASRPTARVVLHQGAVDIGQGSNTVIAQIAADALGLPLGAIRAGRRATPTSRRMPARPRPRARPSSPARRRRRPAGRCARRSCASPMSRRTRRSPSTARRSSVRDGEAVAPHRPRRAAAPTRDGYVFAARGDLRSADHAARRRRARACPMRSTASARRSPRSRSTCELGTVKAGARSPPRTMSAARSTRRWSKARSRAASRRASAWR